MKDIIKKTLVTVAFMLLFRFGQNIIIPGVQNMTQDFVLEYGNFISVLSMVTGGSLETFSIFALGVGPYITAGIIIQILGTGIVPYITKLTEEGQEGRSKLNSITRYLTLFIAAVQSIGLVAAFGSAGGSLSSQNAYGYFTTVLFMVAGMCAVMWIADMITVYGLGNGVSILICAGIAAGFPNNFITVYNAFVGGENGVLKFVLYCLMFIVIVFAVTFVGNSERRIPIQQSNRVLNRTKGDISYIPIKINTASVIPVIFAGTFISVPVMILNIFGATELAEKADGIFGLTTVSGLIIYAVLIFAFTIFYTFVIVDSKKIAANFAKNGTYIPGVRPEKETVDYINKVVLKTTIVGAVFLVIIALIPNIMAMTTGLSSSVALGGTGIIIAVGVANEIIGNIRTMKTNTSYDNYRRFQ